MVKKKQNIPHVRYRCRSSYIVEFAAQSVFYVLLVATVVYEPTHYIAVKYAK